MTVCLLWSRKKRLRARGKEKCFFFFYLAFLCKCFVDKEKNVRKQNDRRRNKAQDFCEMIKLESATNKIKREKCLSESLKCSFATGDIIY